MFEERDGEEKGAYQEILTAFIQTTRLGQCDLTKTSTKYGRGQFLNP